MKNLMYFIIYSLSTKKKGRKERNKARKENNNNNNKLICTTQGNKINQVISIHFIILKNISCTPVRIG